MFNKEKINLFLFGHVKKSPYLCIVKQINQPNK